MLIIICIMGPQAIYQIRPYTFYISGIVIGMILAISSSVVLLNSSRILLNYALFLSGYLLGFFLGPVQMQYITIGLLLTIVFNYLFSDQPGNIYKFLVFAIFAFSISIYWYLSIPVLQFNEQFDYEDKVILASETQHHKLVVTQWQDDNWFFIDKLKNVSSIDEYLYYEPMTHAVFKIAKNINDILVIGGENGCLIREALKHEDVNSIEVVSYDTILLSLGMANQYYIEMNKKAFASKKVKIIQEDLLQFITDTNKKYDAIFIDLPDPRSLETNQYYTIEFYELIKNLLAEQGVMITQAGSPYFATEAYFTIGATIQEAGFNVLPIHNQILTLGEWGWYICSIDQQSSHMKDRLLVSKKLDIETRWFNHEAALLISAFGKTNADTFQTQVNSLDNPVVYQYYLKGTWDMR